MPEFSSLDFFVESPSFIGGVIALLLGLVWGSFVTMASYRIPRGEDLIFQHSHCTHCNHNLHFFDLIPLFSWLSTRGKCRYCHIPVSARYPLTECTLAFLFALIYCQLGLSSASILLALITVCLMIIIVTDLEHYIIPDKIQIILLLLAIPYGIVTGKPLFDMFTGACTGVATGLTLRYLGSAWKKQEALGWGDVKFLAVVGLYLGITPLPIFFFIAGIAGIATSLLWTMSGRGKLFPFAPALVIAFFIALLFPEIHTSFLNGISYLTSTLMRS